MKIFFRKAASLLELTVEPVPTVMSLHPSWAGTWGTVWKILSYHLARLAPLQLTHQPMLPQGYKTWEVLFLCPGQSCPQMFSQPPPWTTHLPRHWSSIQWWKEKTDSDQEQARRCYELWQTMTQGTGKNGRWGGKVLFSAESQRRPPQPPFPPHRQISTTHFQQASQTLHDLSSFLPPNLFFLPSLLFLQMAPPFSQLSKSKSLESFLLSQSLFNQQWTLLAPPCRHPDSRFCPPFHYYPGPSSHHLHLDLCWCPQTGLSGVKSAQHPSA